MKIMLVGGGGREGALAWKIQQSPLVAELLVTAANPGFPVGCTPLEGDLVEEARARAVDLVVVGPEGPLAEGLSDRLREAGIAVFGPSRAAAQLETSKEFAKAFMDRHGIPTARWSSHEDLEGALQAVTGPCVVKADGLAAGKGVVVASTAEEARDAIRSMFAGAFGQAGHRVVVEECLTGPEVSVLALCDGFRAVPLLPCRDHKRRFEDDAGPNTGGMGAICPPPDVSEALLAEIAESVLQRTVDGMAAEGRPFRGVLYAGLMLTPNGPRVLEFNVRFGDPECQPLMMMLDEDIVPLMLGAARDGLPSRPLKWRRGAACCVVMVSGGYPGSVETGFSITGIDAASEDAQVFFAGAKREGSRILSAGGRVLGVTAHGSNLGVAAQAAYGAVSKISFNGADWRKDIGGSFK